jgi:ABC-type multidrug transport system permease subunit
VLTALVTDQRAAGVLTNLAGMVIGLVGGCAFPPQQLPAFLREHITPLMPSSWFAEAVRGLEYGSANSHWLIVSLKLGGLSLLLIGAAVFLFRRRFRKGLH